MHYKQTFCYTTLNFNWTYDLRSIQVPHGILSIPRVLILDEGESGRVPGHPDILERSILVESGLELLFGGIVPQWPYVDLALDIPVSVTWPHPLSLERVNKGSKDKVKWDRHRWQVSLYSTSAQPTTPTVQLVLGRKILSPFSQK